MSVPERQLRNQQAPARVAPRPARPMTARKESTPLPPPVEPARRAAATQPPVDSDTVGSRRWITPTRLFFAAVALITYLGWRLPTERYITPETGFGYALGIIGGSMMLLLFLYSARKRIRWLAFLGSVTKWFETHMVLGILGPLCILYHGNFSLGATNSNVALFCMLTVVGSGFIGRYIYTHIHFGLYGRKMTLSDLQAGADRLRELSRTISFLPQLVGQLEAEERRLLASGPQLRLLGLAHPLVVSLNAFAARWRLRRYVRRALRVAARRSPTLAAHRKPLRRAAAAYIDKRLAATRRVATFQAYERLFSLWHVLHLPIIFMMLIAGVAHVISVHVY